MTRPNSNAHELLENATCLPQKDSRLSWNSTKLEVTSINHERIWTPDISYWNSVSDESELDFPADRGFLRVFSERSQRTTRPGQRSFNMRDRLIRMVR